MPAFVCEHLDGGGEVAAWPVCLHLLPHHDHPRSGYYRRYTGQGRQYVLVCPACDESSWRGADKLCSLCKNCFSRAIAYPTTELGISGLPECAHRSTTLHFVHEQVALREPIAALLDISPITAAPTSRWVALSSDGKLVHLDLGARSASPLVADVGFPVAYEDGRGRERPLSLVVSPAGDLAAVAQTFGLRGQVFDLSSGCALATLAREDYCAEVSPFPLAFVEHDRRWLLIHGTAWNRLDISDPRAGTLLSARPSPTYHPAPAGTDSHYLDYFHGRLAISPNQGWIVDDGWVWHPQGIVVSWSLRDWLAGSVWESEDGHSRKDLCWREDWDRPLCWLADRTLAVWGCGDGDRLEPEVRIFDVPSGIEQRRFAGPHGTLFFDRYLFSCSPHSGTAVWDAASGELLHQDLACRPTHYHPGTRQFLTINPDGIFVLSRLAE